LAFSKICEWLTIGLRVNQSISQSKHICIAPYVANESEAYDGRD